MISTVKEFLFSVKLLVESERKTAPELPLSRKLALWRRGFLSFTGTFYDFETYDYQDYLSDYQRYRRFLRIDRRHHRLINDKLLFTLLMSRWPGATPNLFGVVEHGRFKPERTCQSDELVSLVRAQGSVIVKAVRGAHGDSVRLLEAGADGPLFLDGAAATDDEIRTLPRAIGHSLVQERIRQAAYAARINPSALNTIRVLTLRSPDTREVFIAAAVHRFGTAASGHVDNWSACGLAADVDVETGVLGTACSSPRTRRAVRFQRHPDTDAPIGGVAIPEWATVKSTVLAWADSLPYVTYCGWDVAVDDTGRLRAIEGNIPCNARMFQTSRPLLIDPRTRAYFRAAGVIR